MYSYKKYLLLLLIAFVGCNNEQPTEIDSDLIGLYESSRFIEPGSNDGGVDIQSAGGYLRITLEDDFTFTSELFIPDNIQSNYPKGKTNYEGNYSVKDNLIEFTSSFIVESMKWNKETKQLESLEVPLRGQPFEIILYKYLR